jgi:hypothetical protein
MRTDTALTLGQAAKATGKNKTTILRAVRDGRVSANRDEVGQYAIEPAELFRQFPPATDDGVAQPEAQASDATPRNPGDLIDATPDAGYRLLAEELRRQIDELKVERERERQQHLAAAADLRRRLDASEEERRRKDQQLTALLTDQRPKAPEPALPPAPRRGLLARLLGLS